MTGQRDPPGDLDWGTASVQQGRLTVGFSGQPPSEWSDRLAAVIDRLQRPGASWGTIKVKRKRLRVADVTPGSEDDLRHFLDGAVLQANADLAPADEQDDGDERSDADETMTAVFRSFADESDTAP